MRREQAIAYTIMTLPGLVLYCVFLILPILMGLYYSLTDWTGIGNKFNFIGLDNYIKVFTNDKRFGNALVFNLRYTVYLVIGIVVIGFMLAMLLNREMKGRSFFRTLYFMPAVLSMITIGLVFKQVYFYVLPSIGKAVGSATFSENIIANRQLAIYGILFVHLWQGVALPTLLFLSGLQTIPVDLYEAASIDGANAWHQFKSITVPYILPTLSVVLVLAVKQGLNVFDYINSMTKGGPGGATTSISILIWQNAWERNRFSYAIAQAVITGLIIALISFVQIKYTDRKKVD
ncbi:MAG: sugar ABC transporter permease [Clostridia bacterium]|nr:sugar ABC transporter permease [Clostridia bacterium]